MIDRPRLRYPIWYGCAALILSGTAYLVAVLPAKLSALQAVLVVITTAMGVWMLVMAGSTMIDYWVHIRNMSLYEGQRAKAITPMAELAKAISVLRPDQTALLPEVRYGAEIGVSATERGREFFLITPFGLIPFNWLDQYINELCTRVELYPIRRFANDSKEQRLAQAFTAWVTQPYLHLAFPADGNKPASWVSPAARERCVEMIWGEEENIVHG